MARQTLPTTPVEPLTLSLVAAVAVGSSGVVVGELAAPVRKEDQAAQREQRPPVATAARAMRQRLQLSVWVVLAERVALVVRVATSMAQLADQVPVVMAAPVVALVRTPVATAVAEPVPVRPA